MPSLMREHIVEKTTTTKSEVLKLCSQMTHCMYACVVGLGLQRVATLLATLQVDKQHITYEM